MSTIDRVFATGTSVIDDLLAARKWVGESVTFGFAGSASMFASGYGKGEAKNGFETLNSKQQQATHDAMKLWNDLIAIDIQKAGSASDADIVLGVSDMPSTAWAYTPSSSTQGGDVWLGSTSWLVSPAKGNYGYMTIMHEIGHALGLSHPHEQKTLLMGAAIPDGPAEGLCPCCGGAVHGEVSNGQASNAQAAGETSLAAASFQGVRAIDAMAWSLMSYRSYSGADMSRGYTNETFGYAQTPMARDIAAIQHLYGADYETRSGDTVYRWSETTGEKFINGAGQGKPGGNKVFETVWDGGGRDTFDFSNHTTDLTVDLAPGAWTSFNNAQLANLGSGQKAPGNVALAYLHEGDVRATVENAIGGSGNDKITGNAADNVLVGGAGDDVITGVAGRNVLVGDGLGNELALIGLDRVEVISAAVPVVTTGGDDTLTGGAGNDIFVPGLGENVVRGGEGADTLILDVAFADLVITGDTAGALKIAYEGGSVDATGIEFLAVSDGIFSLVGPLDELAERQYTDEIMLLYRAGLGRDLDAAGLDYWTAALENGNAMDQMALSLIASPEFSERFGTPETMDNTDFLAVLYENVLGRTGAQAEVDYWAGQMAAGAERADVLVAFAQSDENRELAAASLTIETDTGLDLIAVTQAQWAQVWG
ncbi:DUF4214 domain-containing protein [Mesorhizobium sp. CAU 1741]|uniref:DUF4214 domain-containing protein n=1 Tax=Mesorhizobium sp. CAU 1741 TaxID=3140366 RepID=UPI00325BFE27